MTIQQMQNEILAAGWKWQETMFNDSHPNNCILEFTQDTGNYTFLKYPRPNDCVGWGRYPRETAWNMAYEYIILGLRRPF